MKPLQRIPYVGIALAFAGAFFNWFVRGGGVESALLGGRNVSGLRIVNALSFGGVAWLLSGSGITAAFAGLGMLIGSMPRLGEYIAAMKGGDSERSEWWGLWRMTLRGAIWGGCIAAGLGLSVLSGGYVAELQKGLLASIVAGSWQGPVVYAVLKIYGRYKIKENEWVNSWTVGEIIHGAIVWLPLVYIGG